jgi:flagellar hook protein FlgE
MVALIEAKNNFGANVKSAQTMDEMTQTLINMVG